jgi:alkylation response protein AidB-like acyl-CoA dehydrogenase
MAKYYASCRKVSTEAVQIFGGYGYTKDFPGKILSRQQALHHWGRYQRNSKDRNSERSIKVKVSSFIGCTGSSIIFAHEARDNPVTGITLLVVVAMK